MTIAATVSPRCSLHFVRHLAADAIEEPLGLERAVLSVGLADHAAGDNVDLFRSHLMLENYGIPKTGLIHSWLLRHLRFSHSLRANLRLVDQTSGAVVRAAHREADPSRFPSQRSPARGCHSAVLGHLQPEPSTLHLGRSACGLRSTTPGEEQSDVYSSNESTPR